MDILLSSQSGRGLHVRLVTGESTLLGLEGGILTEWPDLFEEEPSCILRAGDGVDIDLGFIAAIGTMAWRCEYHMRVREQG